jgi:hypothetical protein
VSSRRREQGQATVELAFCLPVVFFVLAAVIEVALVAGDQLRLWHAAREAVRVAAVDANPEAPIEAAREQGFPSAEVTVTPELLGRRQGSPVTVSLRYEPPAHVPLVGSLFDWVELSARASMRVEQP